MTLVGALTEVVDNLTGVDHDTLDDDSLHDLVIELTRERDRLAIAHARLLARWDTRGIWRNDQSRSAAARLARDTTSFTATARRELRRARRLTHMPATTTAALSGALSLDQVEVLTTANLPHRHHHMTSDETMLVALCQNLNAADTLTAITYWGQRVDTTLGHEHPPRHTTNHLHASTTLDGNVTINGTLDPLGGAAFTNELHRLTQQQQLADTRNGIDRTPAQRRAAALIEMAQRSAATPPDAQRPRPLFSVLLGDDTFRNLCELANGTVITPNDLTPWITTTDLETILFDGPTTILSVSHRRTFTGALRRAIEVRDRHCQHPSGCDTPANECDIDHITPHHQGGPTSQFNGRLQCPTHNRRADMHDRDTTPPPPRTITRLDELRARIQWRILQAERAEQGAGAQHPAVP